MSIQESFDWWPTWSEEDDDRIGPEPAHVPILSPKNIRRGRLGAGSCRCLLQWVAGFPPRRHSKETYARGPRGRAEDMLITVIAERMARAKRQSGRMRCFKPLIELDFFNDNKPAREVVEIWNESMRRLGWTEAVG